MSPKPRDMFACTTGAFCGEMFAFMEKKQETYKFLSVPKMIVREVPIDKFEIGLQEHIVEYVEHLPKKVWNILHAQYKHTVKA